MDEYLEPCGSVHPNHSELICEHNGKCYMDWHFAAVTQTNGIRLFKVWGRDAEYAARYLTPNLQRAIIPIADAKTDLTLPVAIRERVPVRIQ